MLLAKFEGNSAIESLFVAKSSLPESKNLNRTKYRYFTRNTCKLEGIAVLRRGKCATSYRVFRNIQKAKDLPKSRTRSKKIRMTTYMSDEMSILLAASSSF